MGAGFGVVLAFAGLYALSAGTGASEAAFVVLPYRHSITRELDEGHVRRLQAGESVLPIHGSLKDYGYFFTEYHVGTPPQKFQPVIDTGSTVTYFPCSNCDSKCGKHLNPPYDKSKSSSWERLPCSDPKCECAGGTCCSDQTECSFSRSYAEGSSASGTVFTDLLDLGWGDEEGGNPRVAVGCTTKETYMIKTQDADGVSGLGRAAMALNVQVGARTGGVHGVCLGDVSGGGALVFGRIDRKGEEALPVEMTIPLTRKTGSTYGLFLTVDLRGARVGEESPDGEETPWVSASYNALYGTMFDTGSTASEVPSAAYKALLSQIREALPSDVRDTENKGVYKMDVCWRTGSQVAADLPGKGFPDLFLRFDGGLGADGYPADLRLPPLSYLWLGDGMEDPRTDNWCFGFYEGSSTILGAVTLRNLYVEFDLKHDIVALSRAKCLPEGPARPDDFDPGTPEPTSAPPDGPTPASSPTPEPDGTPTPTESPVPDDSAPTPEPTAPEPATPGPATPAPTRSPDPRPVPTLTPGEPGGHQNDGGGGGRSPPGGGGASSLFLLAAVMGVGAAATAGGAVGIVRLVRWRRRRGGGGPGGRDDPYDYVELQQQRGNVTGQYVPPGAAPGGPSELPGAALLPHGASSGAAGTPADGLEDLA